MLFSPMGRVWDLEVNHAIHASLGSTAISFKWFDSNTNMKVARNMVLTGSAEVFTSQVRE